MITPCDYDEFKEHGLRPITEIRERESLNLNNVNCIGVTDEELEKEKIESESILNGFKP